MEASDLPNPVRFGAFEIDRDAGQLTRSGRRVHLAPQALRLLLLLIDKQGNLVTREEIRAALWSGDTFVDVDSAVNACVSQIRTVLGDKPTAPRFVETIPRRGYRFVAPLSDALPADRVIESVPARQADEPGRSAGGSSNRFRMGLAVGLTGLVVSLLGLAMRAGPDASKRNDAPAYAKTRSLQAIQRLERGRSGLADAAPAELQARVRFFESALELEPDFAEAYAGIADAKLILASYRTESPQNAYTAAKAAAAKALALNEKLADAHATYAAAVLFYEWDRSSAREHLTGPSLVRAYADGRRAPPRSARARREGGDAGSDEPERAHVSRGGRVLRRPASQGGTTLSPGCRADA